MSGLMFLSVGLGYYGLTSVLDAFVRNGGVDALAIGVATALSFLVNGLAARPLSSSMGRFGLRRTVAGGAVVTGAGFVAWGWDAGVPTLILGFLAVGIGVAATSYLPTGVVLGALPTAHLAIALSAGTVGGIVLGPTLTVFLASEGAGGGGLRSLIPLALVYAAVGVGLASLLPGFRPVVEGRGFTDSADRPDAPSPEPASPRAPQRLLTGTWVLVLAIVGGVTLGIQLNVVGFGDGTTDTAVAATAVMPTAALVGRLGAAALGKWASGARLGVTAGLTGTGGCALLATPGNVTFLVGVAAVGMSLGLSVLAGPLLCRALDAARFVSLYARVLLATGVGYAAGSLLTPPAIAGIGPSQTAMAAAVLCGAATLTAVALLRRRQSS